MRFVVKWNNGYWKIFDTHGFKDLRLEALERRAVEGCERLNAGESPR